MILKRYKVKSFRELTQKQRVEILEGLNQMTRRDEVQNENRIHSTRESKRQTETENM